MQEPKEPKGAVWGLGELPSEEVLFGCSEAMREIRQKIQKAASTDLPLLIQGENGTGKEVVARHVHANSVWGRGKFVKVNCAAIPGTLLESELFGYEQGAFTGATAAREGRVEMASGGTLFLDEITEMDISLQAKLLQVLQDGRFSRIGGDEEKCVVTRVICATNRRIEDEVEAGRFRRDLFYRIDGLRLTLPPLRERKADIESLAGHFMSLYGIRFQRDTTPLERNVLRILEQRDWPGNIRELENWIARCVLLGVEEAVEFYASERKTGIAAAGQGDPPMPLRRIAEKIRHEQEHEVILKMLEKYNWNRRKTAAALHISYRTLLYRLREAGLSSLRARKEIPLAFGSLET